MPSDNEERQPARDVSPGSNDAGKFSRQFATAVELPFVLVGTILVGGAIGFFLDRWLHTKPVMMMIFGAIGFAAGIRDVLRRLPKD